MKRFLIPLMLACGLMPLAAQTGTPEQTRCRGNRAVQLIPSSTRLPGPDGGDAADVAVRRAPVRRLEGVPPVKVRLGAMKTYDSSWTDSDDAGFYIIDANDGSMTLQHANSTFSTVIAAVKKGETMYCISTSEDLEHVYYNQYSASTWNSIGTKQEIDLVNVAADLTYDEKTGQVYGFFYTEDDYQPEYKKFAKFSLTTAEATQLRLMEREVYACAADGDGTIYWLSSTQLGEVDAQGKDFDYLFGPKVYPERRNTMAYDPTTGLLYALVTTEQMQGGVRSYISSLYSIDPVSKAVTQIRQFPTEQGFAGLYVLPLEIADDAPGQVSDVSFSFTGDTPPQGTVTLTAPTKTHIGGTLTGPLTIIIEVGGVEHAIYDVQPGARVTSEAYTFAEGTQQVTITVANSTDRGEALAMEVFAGRDIPAAPASVTLTQNEAGKPHISWTAVTAGASNGAIDAASLRYRVVRVTDNVTVADNLTATEYTDEAYVSNGRAVSYDVYAATVDGEGAPTRSNRLAIGVECTVPFAETFDTADDADLWTVEDLNGGATWQYSASSKHIYYKYDENRLPGDDWLYSPAIRLEAGKMYMLTYDYRSMMSSYPESFSVSLGNAATSAAMTRQLADHPQVKSGKVPDKGTAAFSVEADGMYHIGFHETSAPNMYTLTLDNIALREISDKVPAAPALEITPGEGGALSATVTVTAPATDADGGTLEDLQRVVLMRADRAEAVKEFPSPAPGSALSFTDTDITADGKYTYYAYGVNASGEGPETRVTAYIGKDDPGAVENLTLADVDGKPVLTWSAPTAGRNGGWFDTSAMTYTVYRYFGNFDCLAQGLEATTLTDSELVIPDGEQLPASYVVRAVADGKNGVATESNYVLFGTPYAAPLTENFAGADMALYPWMSVTDEPLNSAWTLDASGRNPVALDYSGDQGLATFHSAGEVESGIGSWFISPKISLSAMESPVASFALYHSHIDGVTSAEAVQLFASVEGADYVALSPAYDRDNGTTGWKRHSVDISQLPRDKWVRFAFKGTTACGADMYLDAFSIEEGCAIDAAVTAAQGPLRIAAGEQADYVLTVNNYGIEDIPAGTVTMAEQGGETATAELPAIPAGERVQVSMSRTFAQGRHDLTFSVSVQGDGNAANNTLLLTVNATEPLFPSPTAFTGMQNADGAVELSWQPATARGAVTDDFESYEDWAIDGIGEWLMADRDYDQTVYINAGSVIPGAMTTYPNCTAPKAWQVCNAAAMGINIWAEGTPHSGDKMLMASTSINYVNSDWAISPMLNGQQQTLSFYAKAFTSQDTPAERMRVLYSTGSTVPEEFIALHTADYIEVPDSWTEYRYALPEGARRFAVQCVSDGAFALFLDDVTYNDCTVPVCTLTGYEVLREGEVIATVQEPRYTDTSVPEGDKAQYAVRAIYDKGVSAAAEATVQLSGISGIGGDGIAVAVEVRDIVVTGAAGQAVTLAAADGKTVSCIASAADSERISVAEQGIYILRVGTFVRKVAVR